MDSPIGINSENTAKIAAALNTFLADEFILYLRTRKAHWNIESGDFYYLHQLFENQYKQIDEIADAIAERIRSIGHYASATLQEYLELTHLTERTTRENNGKSHLNDLLNVHQSIVINLRKNIGHFSQALHDAGTSDFITGVMEQHEKMAWMIRSHLKA